MCIWTWQQQKKEKKQIFFSQIFEILRNYEVEISMNNILQALIYRLVEATQDVCGMWEFKNQIKKKCFLGYKWCFDLKFNDLLSVAVNYEI